MCFGTVLVWAHWFMQEELVQLPLKLVLRQMVGLKRVKLAGHRVFLIVVSKGKKLFFFGIP